MQLHWPRPHASFGTCSVSMRVAGSRDLIRKVIGVQRREHPRNSIINYDARGTSLHYYCKSLLEAVNLYASKTLPIKHYRKHEHMTIGRCNLCTRSYSRYFYFSWVKLWNFSIWNMVCMHRVPVKWRFKISTKRRPGIKKSNHMRDSC